jgi:hypothetical protein
MHDRLRDGLALLQKIVRQSIVAVSEQDRLLFSSPVDAAMGSILTASPRKKWTKKAAMMGHSVRPVTNGAV